MDLNEAQQIVIDTHDNEWECDDCFGSSDALAHVCDVLTHPDAPFVPGGFRYEPLAEGPNDPYAQVDEAFLMVLADAQLTK